MQYTPPISRSSCARSFVMWMMAVVLACCIWCGDAAACPSCREAVKSESAKQKAHADMGKGYNVSILVMMAAPFVLAAGFGGFCYMHLRNNKIT